MARQALQANRPGEAESLLRHVLRARPKNTDALHFLGLALYRQGRHGEALVHLHKAVKAQPLYAVLRNNLGLVYLELKRPKQAIDSFRQALRVEPGYGAAWANLGEALQASGDPEGAVAAYQRALDLGSSDPAPRYRMASALLSLDRPQAALKACDFCLEVHPFCQTALAYRTAALHRLGELDRASEIFDPPRFVARRRLTVAELAGALEDFNARLETAVRAHPSLTWEPPDRVTHGGAVSQDLLQAPDDMITQFERRLRAEIDCYLADVRLGRVAHPFPDLAPARYRLTLIASILKGGGWHPPHIHEGAWLSGVYYVKIPGSITEAAEGHKGWLEFGRPDCAMPKDFEPPVQAYRPVAGDALFFPSSYFHGTIPFEGPDERVGIAFDVYGEG
jgi:tetratricopeptide (TPR) repeat protein